MKMHEVQSSNIKRIGHDGNSKMVVEFGSGKYEFTGVSAEDFDGFKNADSQGKHFHQMGIKGTKIVEDKSED